MKEFLIEKLLAKNDFFEREIFALRKENLELKKEIVRLNAKLNKNSKNSSKPPSTDQKGNNPSPPTKERKKRAGISRKLLPPERVNQTVDCVLDCCPHCGSNSIVINECNPEILQQVELPEIRANVTEYLMQKYTCKKCGEKSKASLPKGVPNTVFGPKMMGLLATLTGEFHLAKREAMQIIKDLFNIDTSLGSVSNIEEKVTAALEPSYHRIYDFIFKSGLTKYFDETGWRNSATTHYVWTACTTKVSFFKIDPRRNREAFNKLIGNNISHPAVTDRYAVYKSIKGPHQYCLAHLVRDFRQYAERDGPDSEIAKEIESLFLKILKIHASYRVGDITKSGRNKSFGHKKKNLELLLCDGLANGSETFSRLCEKLLDEFEHLVTFMKVDGMEPTNNTAERNLRKIVIWRKKSYGTRSARGQRFVERITSVAQTLRRQGKNVLHFIQESTISYFNKSEAPYICLENGF